MPDSTHLVIEVIGEGKTDIGPATPGETRIERPTTGVVPILIHTICGSPESMRIKRRKLAFLQGKTLAQKMKFGKRQAKYNRSVGLVCVLDTEGDHAGQIQQLIKGRDAELHDFPAAVGVAHPCIETWLLSDPQAIRRALGLSTVPAVHDQPEKLSAPSRLDGNDPKVVLARCAGQASPLSHKDASKIAAEMKQLDRIKERCPLGFLPFADEVEARIRPIFATA